MMSNNDLCGEKKKSSPLFQGGKSLGCMLCSVKEQSICSHLAERDFQQVEKTMARRFFPKGHALTAEDEANETLFVLVHGSVRLTKQLEDGRRQVTGFLFPGDIFGVHPTKHNAYTAETLEDSQLCRFPHSFLKEAEERAAGLKDRLILRGQEEYHKAQDHIVLLGKKTATERVESFIGLLDRSIGKDTPEGRLVPLPMARRDIADYLGLRLETLSRALGTLKKDGFLAKVTKHDLLLA